MEAEIPLNLENCKLFIFSSRHFFKILNPGDLAHNENKVLLTLFWNFIFVILWNIYCMVCINMLKINDTKDYSTLCFNG